MKKISERLVALRDHLDLSQTDLAEQLGFSRNYVSMIEGGREPGRKFLRAFNTLEAEKMGLLTNERPISYRDIGSPRQKLAAFLKTRGITVAQLAKAIRYDAGVIQNVIHGTGRASEKMIEAMVQKFPELAEEDLMEGSDSPRVVSEDGMHGTYGAKPNLILPPGARGRMVPLLSMAEAGGWDAHHDDGGYTGEAVFALNVDDRRAFAIQVSGNSMEPDIRQGDIVICSPEKPVNNGDCAVVRTKSGQAFIKFWKLEKELVTLESANPDHPPLKFHASEIFGKWPVIQRIAAGRITKQL